MSVASTTTSAFLISDCEIRVGHDVGVDLLDVRVGVPVEQHVGDGIDFLLPDVSPAANMPDDILGSENVIVDQREVADAGHDELKRDAGTARAASRDKNLDIGEQG